MVIYESVHRIERTLRELAEIYGPERPIVIGREITKKFEEFARGTLGEFVGNTKKFEAKGEFVICI